MKLRTKFVLALLMLAVTLGVTAGVAAWGLRFLDRELAWPLRSVESVMSGMHQVKRAGERQADLVLDRTRPEDPAAEFVQLQQAAFDALEALDELPTVTVRSGVSTTRNIRERTGVIGDLGVEWMSEPTDERRTALLDAIEDRHDLIERVEGRILADARLAVDHGRRLETLVIIIITVALLGATSVAVLMSLLVRRWLLVPIERLRAGAERLAAGDFDHRIGLNTGDELGRLGDEFDEMAATIKTMQDERVERERLAAIGEMSRRIVHNLRTPLSGIRGLAETTRSELPHGSDLVEVQDRIIASVDRFEGWLRDVLRASSPIALQPRPLDPAALARSVVEAHADAAAARSVRIRFDPGNLPESVRADAHHLEHALTALVSNAVEFSPPGSEIGIVGTAEDGFWTLEVTDSGPGVPTDLQAAVFRPYFTTRPGGTGIGLALVRQVAERHGGSIVLRSPARTAPEAGETPGAAFTIRLPVDAGAG